MLYNPSGEPPQFKPPLCKGRWYDAVVSEGLLTYTLIFSSYKFIARQSLSQCDFAALFRITFPKENNDGKHKNEISSHRAAAVYRRYVSGRRNSAAPAVSFDRQQHFRTDVSPYASSCAFMWIAVRLALGRCSGHCPAADFFCYYRHACYVPQRFFHDGRTLYIRSRLRASILKSILREERPLPYLSLHDSGNASRPRCRRTDKMAAAHGNGKSPDSERLPGLLFCNRLAGDCSSADLDSHRYDCSAKSRRNCTITTEFIIYYYSINILFVFGKNPSIFGGFLFFIFSFWACFDPFFTLFYKKYACF